MSMTQGAPGQMQPWGSFVSSGGLLGGTKLGNFVQDGGLMGQMGGLQGLEGPPTEQQQRQLDNMAMLRRMMMGGGYYGAP